MVTVGFLDYENPARACCRRPPTQLARFGEPVGDCATLSPPTWPNGAAGRRRSDRVTAQPPLPGPQHSLKPRRCRSVRLIAEGLLVRRRLVWRRVRFVVITPTPEVGWGLSREQSFSAYPAPCSTCPNPIPWPPRGRPKGLSHWTNLAEAGDLVAPVTYRRSVRSGFPGIVARAGIDGETFCGKSSQFYFLFGSEDFHVQVCRGAKRAEVDHGTA